jgi:DNA mismatch repair protein MutL
LAKPAEAGHGLRSPTAVENALFAQSLKQQDMAVAEKMSDVKMVGQVFKTYLILERADTLLVVDQHAAHERLIYERLKQAQAQEKSLVQPLLVPELLKVTPAEADFLEENRPLLEHLGFEFEPFGPHDYQIRGIPFVLGHAMGKAYLMELLDHMSEVKHYSGQQKEAWLIQMACKKAVKGGDSLTDDEVKHLLKLIKEESVPLSCPHGRPIVIEMTRDDLAKRFKRI